MLTRRCRSGYRQHAFVIGHRIVRYRYAGYDTKHFSDMKRCVST